MWCRNHLGEGGRELGHMEQTRGASGRGTGEGIVGLRDHQCHRVSGDRELQTVQFLCEQVPKSRREELHQEREASEGPRRVPMVVQMAVFPTVLCWQLPEPSGG